jgi:protein-L-isoaspartate(D-aspartate) O-methyltransferase
MNQRPVPNRRFLLAFTLMIVFGVLVTTASSALPGDDSKLHVEASQPVAVAVVSPSVASPETVTQPTTITPPRDSAKSFVQYMKTHRQEQDKYLEQRYQRCTTLIQNKDLYREKEIRAFLLTPREKFCRSWNQNRAYDHAFLDIRHGVTISGPHLVGRMTSALDVQQGDKVLEIGTGSGYQAAVLRNLTDQVYTIEIIEALEQETDRLFSGLAAGPYQEYVGIQRKADDGYYGWEEHAPFDKIIVTCGIDHIPPPLLKQLKVGGSMVIPVGPPGAQVILKVTKNMDARGNPVIAREDIYHGRKKEAFVPFTKKDGGTHYQ